MTTMTGTTAESVNATAPSFSGGGFNAVPLPTESCGATHKDLICGIGLIKAQSNLVGSEGIDLADIGQSGWIWATFGLYTPLCLLGIFGNIVTIIMFSKYIKRTTTSVFIISLAIVDLVVCSFSMPIWLVSLLTEQRMDSDFLCRAKKLVDFLAVPLSGTILLVIAIDRFLLIFLVRTDIVTKLRARLIIVALTIVCGCIAIPQPLSFSTNVQVNPHLVQFYCDGKISCPAQKCVISEEIIPKFIHKAMWTGIIVFFMVMVIAYVTFYSLIFLKVYGMHRKMSSWRSRQTSSYMSSVSDRQDKKVDLDHATFASVHHSAIKAPPAAPVNQEDEAEAEPLHSPERHHSDAEDPAAAESEESDLVKNNTPPKLNDNQIVESIVHKRKKRRLPHAQTALTLLLVTVSYVIAYAPLTILFFAGTCKDEKDGSIVFNCKLNSAYNFLWNFFYLNHITNPIIYSFLNPRFKEALKSCLCQKKKS